MLLRTHVLYTDYIIQDVSFEAGLDNEQSAVTSVAKQQRYCPL
jgi:hypothetical protein